MNEKDMVKKLKSLGFKKRWLSDKSGWWYEKAVKHWLFRRVEIVVEEIDGLGGAPPAVYVYIAGCNDAVAVLPIENLNKVLKVFK